MGREITGGLSRPILGRSGFLSEVAGPPYLSASRREISSTPFPLSKLYAHSSHARKGRTEMLYPILPTKIIPLNTVAVLYIEAKEVISTAAGRRSRSSRMSIGQIRHIDDPTT